MITIGDASFEVIKDDKNSIDIELLKTKITDYYDGYDYIVGDWAYGKLRLKGFNEKGSKNYKPINDYAKVEDYIKDYCAYGCKYFILKRIDVDND